MGNFEKRISALEAHGGNREPVNIEIVAGPTIGRREADQLMVSAPPLGAVITRIELVGVRPG
ncbi:MAG: hypothetical protein C0494_15910 [Sphingobium sp.]|nr:hypothetical protein [Sphingobium sp.]